MNPAHLITKSGRIPPPTTDPLVSAVAETMQGNIMQVAGMIYVSERTGREMDGTESQIDAVNVLRETPKMHGNRTITRTTSER